MAFSIILAMDSYILFQGTIEKQPSLDLINALLALDESEDTDQIKLLLSSRGGSVYYGFTIATVIQNLKKRLVIHATNEISSIANIIYLAAKERSAESYAKFFFHGASVSADNLNYEDLNEQVSSMKVQNERIAKFVFEATGMTLNDSKNLMRQRQSLTAEEAVKRGIVQEVKREVIPPNALRKNVIYL
jgi:ATP-dependent protease ClpP protease subunit